LQISQKVPDFFHPRPQAGEDEGNSLSEYSY